VIGVAVAGMTSGLDALVIEPQLTLTTTEIALPVTHGGRLARALGAARVVHLSDLHVTGYGIRERRLAARLKELAPDLVLMTGDYGDGADGMTALTRVLAPVRPRYGVWAVLGNNDHYRGQRDAIVAALEAAGVMVLVNRAATVRGAGGPFAIAGVDDPHYGRDDVTAAMQGLPGDLPVILLAHSPDLLQRKGRGLLINAGDASGPWKRGWFWQDGSHVRPDPGVVVFPTTGRRRVRIVRREDGVGFEEIRLVPAAQDAHDGRGRRLGPLGRRMMREPRHVPGEIVIRASQVRDADVKGGWKKMPTTEGVTLFSVPDAGLTQTWVDPSPESYFEAELDAVEGTAYHVWVRVMSANDQGTSDSLFVQFTDSLNVDGRPDYRIGEAVPEVDTHRVDLMLAGHEHGGQVRLPFIGPLEPNVRRSPYQMGLYQVGEMPLFVSRGIGWSSLPVRFWCPPEVVVIDSETMGRDAGSL